LCVFGCFCLIMKWIRPEKGHSKTPLLLTGDNNRSRLSIRGIIGTKEQKRNFQEQKASRNNYVTPE